MEIFTTVKDMRSFVAAQKGAVIGLVPTMGALHDGHLALVKAAKEKCDVVITSVFVNPIQFGPNEDFAAYPRDFEADCEKLRAAQVAAVFHPTPEEMYPPGFATSVEVTGERTNKLCGARRPGHFKGVATVVTKLINITRADEAFFGQKDAQQVAVVRRFVEDLNLPVNINMVPIVREADGLARSSRNVYLSDEERQAALSLSRGLKAAQKAYDDGERQASTLKKTAAAEMEAESLVKIDYVELVTYPHLIQTEQVAGESLLAVAAFVGKTRLIDNIILGGAR